MGTCGTHTDSSDNFSLLRKEELLRAIRFNLHQMEEYIKKIKKEDVHYKMTKLLFLLNSTRHIIPFIKKIEESDEKSNYDYILIGKYFDDAFMSVWKNDRDQFDKDFLTITQIFNHSYSHKDERNFAFR